MACFPAPLIIMCWYSVCGQAGYGLLILSMSSFHTFILVTKKLIFQFNSPFQVQLFFLHPSACSRSDSMGAQLSSLVLQPWRHARGGRPRKRTDRRRKVSLLDFTPTNSVHLSTTTRSEISDKFKVCMNFLKID